MSAISVISDIYIEIIFLTLSKEEPATIVILVWHLGFSYLPTAVAELPFALSFNIFRTIVLMMFLL